MIGLVGSAHPILYDISVCFHLLRLSGRYSFGLDTLSDTYSLAGRGRKH